MKNKALLARIATKKQNVRFSDFVRLVEAMGFILDRQKGSHYSYRHACGAVLTLQEKGGQAKPYQISQFLSAIEAYGLKL